MAIAQGGARNHKVKIDFPYGKIIYDVEILAVRPGDTIEWEPQNNFPFSVVIKAPLSPLDAGFYTADAGNVIRATVKADAMPGYYPYALSITDGTKIVVEDPDIIVRPPRGG